MDESGRGDGPEKLANRSEFALLDAWRDGDDRAGNALFERQFDALYRFFRTKVSVGVEDLVQETLIATVKSSRGFRKQSSFRTFLFAIARRVLYRSYESRKKGEVCDFTLSSVWDLGPSPSALWARKQIGQQVVEALARVPLQYQTILELYYWEDLSTEEIAEVLDVPSATARTQLRRGRGRLAKVLADMNVTYESLDALVGSLRGSR